MAVRREFFVSSLSAMLEVFLIFLIIKGFVFMDDARVDKSRRRFLLKATAFIGGAGAAFAATPFVASWWPSAKAKSAGAPVECDISQLEYGQQLTIEWRGKPVWVIRRSQAVLEQLNKNGNLLRDPDSVVSEQQPVYALNKYRSIKPDYLVLIGICTHLGCSPKYKPDLASLGAGWPGGFYCPCHGSRFDMAGRVFKGVPAPINMEVPPYAFVNDHTIIVGLDPELV